jgi:hypothetical protein
MSNSLNLSGNKNAQIINPLGSNHPMSGQIDLSHQPMIYTGMGNPNSLMQTTQQLQKMGQMNQLGQIQN